MTDPREPLGRLVREVWVDWAREQPAAKPSWLLGWDELDDGQREVDMRIGAAVAAAERKRLGVAREHWAHPIAEPPAARATLGAIAEDEVYSLLHGVHYRQVVANILQAADVYAASAVAAGRERLARGEPLPDLPAKEESRA